MLTQEKTNLVKVSPVLLDVRRTLPQSPTLVTTVEPQISKRESQLEVMIASQKSCYSLHFVVFVTKNNVKSMPVRIGQNNQGCYRGLLCY
jgi:hypothetical protein